jgi:hypothetical protein
MSIERQQAIQYLRASAGGLWRWSENGSVLVWRDGSTIAFREEIVQIIEWLAPNGLPPFGAIVFLLAACKNKIPASTDLVEQPYQNPVPQMAGMMMAINKHHQETLAKAGSFLSEQFQRLAVFPPEIIAGSKAKCVLAEAVFETAKKQRHVEAREILAGLRTPLSDDDLLGSGRTDPQVMLAHASLVADGLKRHSAESLALRLKTGLDSLPVAPEEELPTAERARQLIKELSRDRELGIVARAARELMAAVRLPRRLGEREQLAFGGVSDITNRGSLDRLLLSELAHDDLTLSVRVALNEALYLRREPPAHEPPGVLALLLDSGLRLWGVPRVLATAVALALIARDKHAAQVFTWRARGKQLAPVDLLSSAGLAGHLEVLEADIHPGDCVTAFAKAIAANAQGQSVLITHRDTLADPEFLRALSAVPDGPGFIAAVDNDGRFELHALPLSRRAPVCQADLDLAALFSEAPNIPLIKKNLDPDLPAIFGVTPFPFLLPLQGRASDWATGEDGYTYAELNDRRLVRFPDTGTGGRILAADLPAGKTIWLDCVDGAVHLVKSSTTHHPARLVTFPLLEGPLRVMELMTGPEPLAVHHYGNVILVIRAHDVRAYSLIDGSPLGTIRNPYQWVHGRFLRGDQHFYFAVWDGERVKFEPVPLAGRFSHDEIMVVFERAGMSGPWLINRRGSIAPSAGEGEQQLSLPPGAKGLSVVMVSRDGHRIYASVNLPRWTVLKKLVSGETHYLSASRNTQLLLDPPPPLPSRNLYRYLTSIGVAEDGLVLFGRRARSRKIIRDEGGVVRLSDFTIGNLLHGPVAFKPSGKAAGHGCSLQLAEWPNGSRAWFDDRGLLHLRSNDPGVPEISLVLCHGELAGWTSQGFTCGPAFFFEGSQSSEPQRVFESVMQFIKHL